MELFIIKIKIHRSLWIKSEFQTFYFGYMSFYDSPVLTNTKQNINRTLAYVDSGHLDNLIQRENMT